MSTLPFTIRRLLPLGGRRRFGEKNLYLADGGFIENTAVLPLLRRKCSEIIAIDARMDPYMLNVEFDLLRTVIEKMGGTITLPESIVTYGKEQKSKIKMILVITEKGGVCPLIIIQLMLNWMD